MSVGCMLSRVRTGMSNNEVTCAIPASRVSELIERLRAARVADNAVAAYAADDFQAFCPSAMKPRHSSLRWQARELNLPFSLAQRTALN